MMMIKLSLIANNVERLESNVHTIDEKVCQLDSKLSTVDSEAIQEKVLGTIKALIDDHFFKVLNASERTDDILKTTSTLLTSLNSQNKEFQNNVMESYKGLFDNVTRGLDEVFTRNMNAADTLKSKLVSFTEDVDRSWRMLESSTNMSSDKTLNALQKVLNLNETLVNHIKSVVTDLFLPTSCEKGKPILFTMTSTPYPVIYENNIEGLDGPLLCDTETDQGGWIVIQRRSTGNVDFYRDWAAYKKGFGSLNDDFWLGNEKIHLITNSGKYQLRIELKYQGKSAYAVYDSFSLSGEDDGYKLSVGTYSGTAGDSLSYHNNMKLSTFDKDNDHRISNCAQEYTGAWWYNDCHHSNLNKN